MFACLFISDFSAQAIIRCEPTLCGRPVVVLAGRPPLEKVMALNESARKEGVEVGTSKTQLEAWENLVFRSRSELQEKSAHAALLDCAQSFSPEVEDTALGTALLNLSGLEPLLGSLSKIAKDLERRISQMGLQANVAVATNPDAALLAARGFTGVTLIPEGREAEYLGDLPVDLLLDSFSSDPGQATRWIETLDRWGIRKLRALAALPEVPLSERLGQQGIRLQKLSQGVVSRDLRVLEPQLIFAESMDLEFPIVLLEPLSFLLNRMLEQVCVRLVARALAVQELKLVLELEATPTSRGTPPAQFFTRTLQLPVPMLDAKVFLKLMQLDLQAHPPGAPIRKIHLSAEPARPRALQSGLFQPLFPEPEKLELTLARITGIVGEGRSGSVELLDTHREGAFAVRHFAPIEPATEQSAGKQLRNQKKDRVMPEQSTPEKSMSGKSVQEKNSGCMVEEKTEIQIVDDLQENAQERMGAVIALRLFRPPLDANVILREAKPVQLQCLQREDIAGEIVWTAGPWRSSGDWSDQQPWAREEWDIAVSSETGLILYRLVQDKRNEKWFVEGMYD